MFIESAFENWEFQTLRFNGYTEEWLDFVVQNRNRKLIIPAHSYDIVEGPVADDDITTRIDDYLEGNISKSDFLKELAYHRPTHQICLCTHQSLQAIETVDKKHIKSIDDLIVEALVIDCAFSPEKAIDVYFDSKTYSKLIDESSGLYAKSWTEIYRLLKKELKIIP